MSIEETPEPPEKPGAFGYAQYVWHYAVREGSVIRAAPFSFAIAMLVVGAPIYWYASSAIRDQYTGQIDDLKSANEKLDATTKSLQATIEFQDRKLASFTTSKLSEADPHASRLQYISSLRLAPSFPVGINVTFLNTGDLASIGAQFFGHVIVSEVRLSKDDLDKYFSGLESALKPSDSTFETQPKDSIFHSIVADNVTIEMANSVTAGHAFLYVFAGQRYRDDNTPPGKYRITEVCLIGHANSAVEFCEHHNRIFLSD
jgi:hypothetical protein